MRASASASLAPNGAQPNMPSRRGFLGALAAITAAPAAPAGAVALSQAVLAAAEPAKAPATALQPELAALRAKLTELAGERARAAQAAKEAHALFWRLCPPRPNEMIVSGRTPRTHWKFVSRERELGEAIENYGPGSDARIVYDPVKLQREASNYLPHGPRGRWIAKRLALAAKFDAEAKEALARSGYVKTLGEIDRVEVDIGRACERIFKVEAKSHADCMVQARAIDVTASAADYGARWVWHAVAPDVVRTMLRFADEA